MKLFRKLFRRWFKEDEPVFLGEEFAVITPQDFREMKPLGPMAKKKEKTLLGAVMVWFAENWLLLLILFGSFYVVFIDTNWNWVFGLRSK